MSEGPDPSPPLPPPHTSGRIAQSTPRRFVLWLGGTLLLLGILLHRPLLQATLTAVLSAAAQRDGLSLEIKLSGNLFTHLTVESLDLKPLKMPHPVVESIHLEKAELHYSLPRLLWSGPGECLQSYKIRNAHLRLKAPPAQSALKRTFAELLEDLLARPALYADSVEINRLDLELEGSPFLRSIRNLKFSAFPNTPGSLTVESLALGEGPPLENLKALTAYPHRHLEITGLLLNSGLELRSFSFDASERSLGKSTLSVDLRYNQGRITGKVFSQRPWEGRPPKFRAEFSALGFPLHEAGKQIGGYSVPIEELEWAEAHLQGNPKNPASWEGQADLRFQLPLAETSAPLVAELHSAFHSGKLTIESLHAYSETNTASASGEVLLADSLQKWDQLQGLIQFRVDAEDFSILGVPKEQATLFGSGAITGTMAFHEGRVDGALRGEGQANGSTPLEFSRGILEIEAHTKVAHWGSLSNLHGILKLSLQNPSLRTESCAASFDQGSISLALREGTLECSELALSRDANRITATGTANLLSEHPRPFAKIETVLPNLAQIGLTAAKHHFSGHVQGSFEGNLDGAKTEGSIECNASTLRWGAFDLGQLNAKANVGSRQLSLQTLLLKWNTDEWFHAEGTVDLSAHRQYSIKSETHLSKLERLTPLIQQCGSDATLSGSLSANWTGEGSLTPPTGRGSWNFQLKNGRWKEASFKEVLCDGNYGDGQFNASPFRIVTPNTRFNAQLSWNEETLRVQQISLEQWGYPTLSGYLLLPFSWNQDGLFWNRKGRLTGQLNADRLDLVTLFTAAGQPAPLAGWIQCVLSIAGTPDEPTAAFKLAARELRSPQNPSLGNAEFDLSANLKNGSLHCEASLQSILKTPVKLTAEIPLPLPDLISGKTSLTQLPVKAHLEIPKANLSPLPSLWNGFKKFEGALSLDTSFQGSWDKPQWHGTLHLDVPVIHFVSYRFPAIVDLKADVAFDERAIRVQSLRADVGGGNVKADGIAHLSENFSADLDFHAVAHEMLIVRSRELSLRLDGDVRLRGPWQAATISGLCYSVKSRVTRDIDILPATILKKTATQLPTSNPGKPWFTFQRAPFSDWKFDVTLNTHPDDPLLIRGNRLHGTAEASLALRGTGGAPTLDGNYKTTNLTAFMPFARIDVSRGHFWYFPNQPFRTQLDFTAEAEVRNHRIRLFVTGTPEVPKINLTSDPPLAETDLLTLLTTGILPGDTNESGQALAGRAAAVLFQELSGKLFDQNNNRERPSALRRFDLDVGALNTRTGHQETTLSYRVTDKIFVLGELGANGDFGGQIKYLIRFR